MVVEAKEALPSIIDIWLPSNGKVPPTVPLLTTSVAAATFIPTKPELAEGLRFNLTNKDSEPPAATKTGLQPKLTVTLLSEVKEVITSQWRLPAASQTLTPDIFVLAIKPVLVRVTPVT